MFRNRELTVKMGKTNDKKQVEGEEPSEDQPSFDAKAALVQRHIESAGMKIFAGICIYVVLDTWRQVSVEGAKNYLED